MIHIQEVCVYFPNLPMHVLLNSAQYKNSTKSEKDTMIKDVSQSIQVELMRRAQASAATQ